VGALGREEFGDEHFASSIVQKAEQGELWAAILEPAVETSVEQVHFPFPSAGQAALAMRGSRPRLAHARSPFTHNVMTATRCNSF
jgi:hypothetical protein